MYKWPAMEEFYNELIKSGQAVFSANVNLLCFGGFAYKILALKGTWDGITLLCVDFQSFDGQEGHPALCEE